MPASFDICLLGLVPIKATEVDLRHEQGQVQTQRLLGVRTDDELRTHLDVLEPG